MQEELQSVVNQLHSMKTRQLDRQPKSLSLGQKDHNLRFNESVTDVQRSRGVIKSNAKKVDTKLETIEASHHQESSRKSSFNEEAKGKRSGRTSPPPELGPLRPTVHKNSKQIDMTNSNGLMGNIQFPNEQASSQANVKSYESWQQRRTSHQVAKQQLQMWNEFDMQMESEFGGAQATQVKPTQTSNELQKINEGLPTRNQSA